MFAQRLKQLRGENGITQVQLAEQLGVSKGTVAMWEIGKREPNFDTLVQLSDIFDRRTDYILGHSEDASSVQLSEDKNEQLGRWEAEDSFYQTILQYLRLDHFGKRTVERVVDAEIERCREQESLFPESNFKLIVRIKAKASEDVQNAEHI